MQLSVTLIASTFFSVAITADVCGELAGRDAYDQQSGHKRDDWYLGDIDQCIDQCRKQYINSGVDDVRDQCWKQYRDNYGQCVNIIVHGE
ncbi:hypothetical protein VP1G_11509 [Cytospora mali]|nr:hypothetical protein VP1G_11509 [Valsa mali var. pyri (nom. inval.)]